MKAEVRNAERAGTAGVREATDGVKTELRRQINSAGLGTGLANTWRRRRAKHQSRRLVWSKAPGSVRMYSDL